MGKKIIYGIQGGRGSYNEEAVLYYLNQHKIKNYEIKYLYSSNKVLKSLVKQDIDYGQFAFHNSIGGIVNESIQAMKRYKFKIINMHSIKISHSLMIRTDSNFDQINTIMTHPQVLAQCKKNLYKKYSRIKLISGKGDLVDHALVAKYLSEKKLAQNIATMGSKVLAEIYDLKVIEDNLQDFKDNLTSFLLVCR